MSGAPKPKITVADYSRAFQGALSLVFKNKSIKDYVACCFSAIRSGDIYLLAPTFIRVDVSHFMAICCRFKCFSKDNYAVMNFLIRVVALLVSCDNFERFDHILTLLLTVTSNSYDSAILNGIETPLPAKKARLVLQQYTAAEEDGPEFKKILLRLIANKQDP